MAGNQSEQLEKCRYDCATRPLVFPRDFAPQSGQGAACSRLVAMSARHLMIHNGRKRLPVGLSVDEQF
jgi:hypothetical protein